MWRRPQVEPGATKLFYPPTRFTVRVRYLPCAMCNQAFMQLIQKLAYTPASSSYPTQVSRVCV
eukprot:591455-Rhodomonas_salina.3